MPLRAISLGVWCLAGVCSYSIPRHAHAPCCIQVVVEPSGAAGVAAALSNQLRERHPGLRHVGVILCGGNVDFCSRTPDFWQRWLQPSPAAS